MLRCDVDNLGQEIGKELIDPDETLIWYRDSSTSWSGDWEEVLTNRRLLYGGRPLTTIPLDKIASIEIEWSPQRKTLMTGYTIRFHEERIPLFFNLWVLGGGGQRQDTWRESLEHYPRMICEAAGVPFAIPKIVPAGNFRSKPKGIVVEFFPKTDLAWPEACASCLSPAPTTVARQVTISAEHLTTEAMPKHWLTTTPTVSKAPNIDFHVPYCPDCFQKRFGGFRSKKAVWHRYFDGLRIALEFEDADFAQQFVECNSLPLGSSLADK